MGKVVKATNNKMNSRGVKKITPNTSKKRLVMLQRRISSLMNEKSSEEEKYRDLFNNLKAEKMLTASLKKESFDWQRKYHESTMALNRFKVKQAEIIQTLSACLGEIDSIYPQMVAFSGSVTSNKIRINNLLASLRSSDYNILPREFHENGKENPTKKSEKPMRQRVGPMVKGLLITKPKIMLERLMLPQPQDQDPVSPDMSNAVVNNQLTPIPEEVDHEEDLRLRHISVRPKRKLGRSWRVTKEKNDAAKKVIEKRTDKAHPIRTVYEDDSSDMESNLAAASHVEPVLRLKDVSRMLKNSSLLKVDSTRTGDTEIGVGGNSASRLTKMESRRLSAVVAPDDPLEGSSWMFNNNHNHHRNFCSTLQGQRQSSLYNSNSDSSDDENENIVSNSKTNVPTVNSLLISDQTFVKKSKNSSFSSRTSCSTSASLQRSPGSEPDSTNNIDAPLPNNCSMKDSVENTLNKSISSSTSTSCLTESNNTLNRSNSQNQSPPKKQMEINSNSPTVHLSVVHNVSKFLSSTNCSLSPSKRLTSFGEDCSPIPSAVIGKRVRKQKNILYPGEEDVHVPNKKKVSDEHSSKRKIFEEKTSKSRRSSTSTKPVIQKKKTKKESNTKKRKSSQTALNTQGGGNTGRGSVSKGKKTISDDRVESQPLSKSKYSSSKKSTNTLRTSSIDRSHSSLDNGELSRPRRTKLNVFYKESPLNVKQRRP